MVVPLIAPKRRLRAGNAPPLLDGPLLSITSSPVDVFSVGAAFQPRRPTAERLPPNTKH
jgi:hypothetical protein